MRPGLYLFVAVLVIPAQLEEGAVLSEPVVRDQFEKIKKLYAEKGFFLAQVSYKLDPRPNDQIAVRFVIDEGEEVTVRRLRFIGNSDFHDRPHLYAWKTLLPCERNAAAVIRTLKRGGGMAITRLEPEVAVLPAFAAAIA